MTDERKASILQIADELESQGLTATNSAVYARALGHRGHVVQTLRRQRSAAAGRPGGRGGRGDPEDRGGARSRDREAGRGPGGRPAPTAGGLRELACRA